MSTGDDIKMTEEEAFSYLQDNLHMTSAKQRRQANRESFLNEIVVAIHRHLPWHTVKNLNTPQEKRHLPTLEEIKEDMYEGTGGLCYTLNVFCSMLLQALGFEVAYVPSDVRGYKDVHILLMVRHLTAEGSSHMVDVGSSSPLFRAISFDFEGETSPVYQDSFLRYRFVRQGDSVVQDHATSSDPHMAAEFDGTTSEWFTYLTIHYKRYVGIDFFKDTTRAFYTVVNPDVPFLTSLRCLAFPDNRFICIKDTTLLKENEDGRVEKSYFRSRDEILSAFRLYFPQFPRSMILTAMNDEYVSFDFNKQKCD
nr:uncharacterized protein LOC129277264 [Lytechinus pictus]